MKEIERTEMKNEVLHDMDAGDLIETQALTWMSRLLSGDADERMLRDYEVWRDADPQHQLAMAEASRLWVDLGTPLTQHYAPRLASRSDALEMNRNRVGQARPRWSRWRPVAAAAAAAALAIGMGQQWLTDWRFDEVTAMGQQRALTLADGSTLWLNSDSAVDVRINGGERHVTVARGEAYFDVVHDPSRPFIVDAGFGKTEVLGTAFSVLRHEDDMQVTVQRGKVRVSGGNSPIVDATPGMRVSVRPEDRVKKVDFVNPDYALSWRNGRLIFEDRPLSEIFEELERYDDRLVFVRYPEANKVRMTAIVDLARIDEWYDGLEQSLPLRVTRFGMIVWIRESADAPSTADVQTSAMAMIGANG